MNLLPVSETNQRPQMDQLLDKDGELDTIHKLERLFQERKELTLAEVNDLDLRTQVVEKEMSTKMQGRGLPYIRIFSRMGMFAEYFKVKRFKNELNKLKKSKEKEQEQQTVDKLIWQCQRRGFVSHMGQEEITRTFYALSSHLPALQVVTAFTIGVASKEKGLLELYLFSQNSITIHAISLKQPLGTYSIGKDTFTSIEALLTLYATDAVPLNQLQEVVMWLETHGATGDVPQRLTAHVVEEKLSKLMKSCPSGAYVLYPAESGGLALSRLLRHGDIHHFTIDLKRKPGCFTFNISGTLYSATRAEFKKKLETMGTAIRIQVHHG